jgi:ribosomal protein S18 acetylase RimI-like enzyme
MHVHEFSLRLATPEDAGELSAFGARTFVETFGKDNTAEDMDAYIRSAFSAELQAREIAELGVVVLLAFVLNEHSESGSRGEGAGAELAGYAHLARTEVPSAVAGADAIELKRFYVAKEWQGSGLAKTLMMETVRHAKAGGARTLWLGVWEHNARAIAFYRKHGFRQVGSHAFLLGSDRQTDLLMALWI